MWGHRNSQTRVVGCLVTATFENRLDLTPQVFYIKKSQDPAVILSVTYFRLTLEQVCRRHKQEYPPQLERIHMSVINRMDTKAVVIHATVHQTAVKMN